MKYDSRYTVTAEIHHGQYRATLKATGGSIAAAMLALPPNGYLATPDMTNWSKIATDLETTGKSALGWVDYTATTNAPAAS